MIYVQTYSYFRFKMSFELAFNICLWAWIKRFVQCSSLCLLSYYPQLSRAVEVEVSYVPGDSVKVEVTNIDDSINITGPGISATGIDSNQTFDFTNTLGPQGGSINIQLVNGGGGYTCIHGF